MNDDMNDDMSHLRDKVGAALTTACPDHHHCDRQTRAVLKAIGPRVAELRKRGDAFEAAVKSTVSDAMEHWLCHMKLHGALQRAEKAEAERDRYRTAWWSARIGRAQARQGIAWASHQLNTLAELTREAEAERDQLRYERQLLFAARMVLDQVAFGSRADWFNSEQISAGAEDVAQRIVDEIGHSVTDEPALGPTFRVEIDRLKATIARVQAVHRLIEWVSLSDVCGRHHYFGTVEPTAENIAVADVCADCKPRRYMGCVCADDECPVLAALDQAEEVDQ